MAEELNIDNISVEKRSDIYPLTGKYNSNQNTIKTMLIGMNLDDYQKIDAVSLLNAPENFTLKQGECVISKKSADKFGLAVGDPITISFKENDFIFHVSSLAEPNRTFYQEKGNFKLLITLEDANMVNHTSGMITKTRIKTAESVNLAAVISKLQSQNGTFTVYEKEEFESLHFQLSTVSSAMFLLIIIVILIGVYVLFSLVKLIMIDRLPILGTFRSVGANRTKIIGILLLEFLFYGVIGTSLGIIAAILLLPFTADLFNQYKEFGVATEVTYQVIYGITAALIGLLLPALSAMTHIIKTSKVTLKDIILKPSSKTSET